MADNVVADAGAGGSTFAAAELSFSGDTVVVPGSFVGILSGSEGSWTFSLLVGGAGSVSAGVQRVTLASDDPAVALLGTIDTDTGNAATALQLIDNVIYVDDADWTATSSSHALIGGVYQSTPGTITDGDTGPLRLTANGAAHVAVQNTVTVASHAVTNAGTFAVQAAQSGTWTVDLGATDNAVLDSIDADLTTIIGHVDGLEGLLTTIDGDTGTLAGAVSGTEMQVDVVGALPAGNNNIGDVDVASIVPGTGATNLGKAIDTATGGTDTGVLALATRDDALSALTPAEGDNVQLRTDANGALWVIPSGTITVASHAVTNAGTFAVQVDGNALTALQLIDDVVFADDAAFTLGTSKGVMMMGFAGTQSVDANDAAALSCTTAGALHVSVQGTVTVGSHAVTNAGTFAVQVDGNALTSLQLLDDAVFTDDAAFTPGTSKGLAVGFQADESSTDSVDEGDFGVPRMTLDRKSITTLYTHAAAGGCSAYNNTDLQETDVEIKSGAGKIYGLYAWNLTAGPLWIKLHDALATNVTPGTTAPTYDFMVPANADSDGAGVCIPIPPMGLQFSTGITIYGSATRGTTAADVGTAGNLGVLLFYS